MTVSSRVPGNVVPLENSGECSSLESSCTGFEAVCLSALLDNSQKTGGMCYSKSTNLRVEGTQELDSQIG